MGFKDKLVAAQKERFAVAKEKTEAIKDQNAERKEAFEDKREEYRDKKAERREKMDDLKQKRDDVKEQYREKKADIGARAAERKAGAAGVDTAGSLFVGESHESGRNSVVTLYPDRLERVKAKKMGSLSSAAQDVEVTPVRAISSVQAKKDGMVHTKVTVFASGNNIDFRFNHGEAAQFKTVLTDLILRGSAPAPAASAPVDLADQLGKLAALRDQGILTDDEFAAQKAKLLG